MSGFNYSKFDHIDSDSDDVDVDANGKSNEGLPRAMPMPPNAMIANAANASVSSSVKPTKKGKQGRLQFEYEGRTIYEWEQSLEEVNIYIEPPPQIPSNMIFVEIEHRHLKVGLKGTDPFIDEDTWGPIKVDESMWTLSDGEININLQKMNKAEAWDAALQGRTGEEVDALTKEEVKKNLMIERFQEGKI
jgi:hypothetical protein